MKVYCYSRCTTCKKALKWLEEKHIAYESIDIKENNPSKEELRAYYEKSGLALKKFFNTSGLKYRALGLKDKLKEMSEEEQLDLLSTDGLLVKRPLVVTEEKVLLGFREEVWRQELLKE